MTLTRHTDRLATLPDPEPFLAGTAGTDPQPAVAIEAGRHAPVLSELRQFRQSTMKVLVHSVELGQVHHVVLGIAAVEAADRRLALAA